MKPVVWWMCWWGAEVVRQPRVPGLSGPVFLCALVLAGAGLVAPGIARAVLIQPVEPLAQPVEPRALPVSPCRAPRAVAEGADAVPQPATESAPSDASDRAPHPTARSVIDALPVGARPGLPGVAAQAHWRYAVARFNGQCPPRNHTEAATHFQLAAQAGHVCALGAWGLMRVRGWGTLRSPAQGREQLLEAAQSGCARAWYWAWLAEGSFARPEVHARTEAGLALGAADGDGHALNALGSVREVAGERELARQLYEQARAAGNTTAQHNLARLARLAARDAQRPTHAMLDAQAERGDASAQYGLARRFHQGDGVAVNYVQALAWYQKAALQGHIAARNMLALVQARMGSAQPGDLTALAELAGLELTSDELNKPRGVAQPIEDEDPFAGL